MSLCELLRDDRRDAEEEEQHQDEGTDRKKDTKRGENGDAELMNKSSKSKKRKEVSETVETPSKHVQVVDADRTLAKPVSAANRKAAKVAQAGGADGKTTKKVTTPEDQNVAKSASDPIV